MGIFSVGDQRQSKMSVHTRHRFDYPRVHEIVNMSLKLILNRYSRWTKHVLDIPLIIHHSKRYRTESLHESTLAVSDVCEFGRKFTA